MPWVRIDDGFAQHTKVLAAGPLAMAMQVAALCYCNRNLTDGFVPRAAAATLLSFEGLGMRLWGGKLGGGGEDATWQLVAEDLEAAGLWEPADGGWRIHDYDKYQPSKADVIKERAQTAARVRAFRGRNAVTSPVGNAVTNADVPGSGSGLGSVPDPEGGGLGEGKPTVAPGDWVNRDAFGAHFAADLSQLARVEAAHPRPGGGGEAAPEFLEAARADFRGDQRAAADAMVAMLGAFGAAEILACEPARRPYLSNWLKKRRYTEPRPAPTREGKPPGKPAATATSYHAPAGYCAFHGSSTDRKTMNTKSSRPSETCPDCKHLAARDGERHGEPRQIGEIGGKA